MKHARASLFSNVSVTPIVRHRESDGADLIEQYSGSDGCYRQTYDSQCVQNFTAAGPDAGVNQT